MNHLLSAAAVGARSRTAKRSHTSQSSHIRPPIYHKTRYISSLAVYAEQMCLLSDMREMPEQSFAPEAYFPTCVNHSWYGPIRKYFNLLKAPQQQIIRQALTYKSLQALLTTAAACPDLAHSATAHARTAECRRCVSFRLKAGSSVLGPQNFKQILESFNTPLFVTL